MNATSSENNRARKCLENICGNINVFTINLINCIVFLYTFNVFYINLIKALRFPKSKHENFENYCLTI